MQKYQHSRLDPKFPKSSLLALNLSESLFTVDTVVGSFQSKSSYVSEDYGDNGSSDMDIGSGRVAFKRKDHAPESTESSQCHQRFSGVVEAGRSLTEPSVDWTVFKSAQPNMEFVAKSWRELHPRANYAAGLLVPIAQNEEFGTRTSH